ncbi:hypothetical protein B0H34DRAFT_800149 [Crassisporium funariophilum]|nr:hypothetical protein B0H34DRAFT_800149 [Crassisporium funariophilum]
MENAYTRRARPEDFEFISSMGAHILRHDPLMAYFGCASSTPFEETEGKDTTQTQDDASALKNYVSFILHSCWMMGGIVDIVCLPQLQTPGTYDESEEKIVAVAVWLPPLVRVKPWNVYTMLRSGLFSLGTEVGFQGLGRMGWEFPLVAANSWRQGYYCLTGSRDWAPEDSWYLKIAFTDRKYQQRGLMTMLLKHRFAGAANSSSNKFTLEATTVKAREYFTHMGFEVRRSRSL